jgi:hypothetical protein
MDLGPQWERTPKSLTGTEGSFLNRTLVVQPLRSTLHLMKMKSFKVKYTINYFTFLTILAFTYNKIAKCVNRMSVQENWPS